MSDLGPEDRYFRLKPVYRSLYRAVRAAEQRHGAADAAPPEPVDDEIVNPVHTQIRQQVAELLENTELSDDERRRVLDSIACPCCGGTGASFSLSLKPAGIKQMGQGGF